jgi:hypothetical protein
MDVVKKPFSFHHPEVAASAVTVHSIRLEEDTDASVR